MHSVVITHFRQDAKCPGRELLQSDFPAGAIGHLVGSRHSPAAAVSYEEIYQVLSWRVLFRSNALVQLK